MNTSTVQNQVKLQMLGLKWQKKKQDINNHKTENMTQDQIMLQNLERQAEAERKRAATSEIYTKLKSGGTLTADEIAYLKEHDPEAYADYEKAQTEKKAYEQALKNCRTKEVVERLKLNRMGNFAAQAKSIANSPYIPKDKKLELMNKLNNEVCCIRDTHMEFIKSRVYEDLPEEAEIAEEVAKERATESDDVAKIYDESTSIIGEDNKDRMVEEENNLPDGNHEVETNNESFESKNITFEKISQDIERYLRRNDVRKSNFVARV